MANLNDPRFTNQSNVGSFSTTSTKFETSSRSAAGRIDVKLDDKEVLAILRAFSKMDKQASVDLRELSRQIADDLVNEFRNSARGTRWYPKQASFVAQTARVARDRTPAVTIGGAKIYSTSNGRRVSPGSLLFLSEFGSLPSKQRERFRNQAQRRSNAQGGLQGPPRSPAEGGGNRGYWIFPRLRRLQPDILRRWINGAQKVADQWGKQ